MLFADVRELVLEAVEGYRDGGIGRTRQARPCRSARHDSLRRKRFREIQVVTLTSAFE